MNVKVCTSCGVRKPLSDFYYRKDRQKHRDQCNACYADRPSARAKRLAAGKRDERQYMELVLIDRERGIVQHVRAPIVSSAPICSLKRMDLTIDFYRDMGCKVVELDMAESETAK